MHCQKLDACAETHVDNSFLKLWPHLEIHFLEVKFWGNPVLGNPIWENPNLENIIGKSSF